MLQMRRIVLRRFFWKENDVEYPSLAPAARYLMWLPVVVTGADGVFSVENAIISCRRNRLNEETAASLVQWKCNGDFLGLYKGSFKTYCYQPIL